MGVKGFTRDIDNFRHGIVGNSRVIPQGNGQKKTGYATVIDKTFGITNTADANAKKEERLRKQCYGRAEKKE